MTVLDDETVIRMERIEYALKAMAHALATTHIGFLRADARGVEDILAGKRDQEVIEALRDEDAPK